MFVDYLHFRRVLLLSSSVYINLLSSNLLPLLLPLSIFDLTPLPKRSRRKHLTSNPFLESGKRKKKKKEIQLLEKAKCKRKAARLQKRQLESSQRTRPSESRGIHSNGSHVERISLLPGIASTSQAHIQTKRV